MNKHTTVQLTPAGEAAAQYLITLWELSPDRGRSAAINRALTFTAKAERGKASPTPRACQKCGTAPITERAPDQSKYAMFCPACDNRGEPASDYAGAVAAWNDPKPER